MKNKNKLLTIIFLMLTILIVLFILFSTILDNSNDVIKKIYEETKIEIDKSDILENKNTHGGFLGDGERFAKISLKKEKFINKNFKELPYDKEIENVMNSDIELLNQIPNLKKGYYLFIDRHSESKNKYNTENLNNRYSYNFTIMLYDDINQTLYYYELDT